MGMFPDTRSLVILCNKCSCFENEEILHYYCYYYQLHLSNICFCENLFFSSTIISKGLKRYLTHRYLTKHFNIFEGKALR